MGLATARILGRDHRIVLADLDQARLDTTVADPAAAGADATGTVCDITDRGSVERLLDVAAAGGHHVRTVVHTAGISPQMGTAARVARINGTGTVNVTQAYLHRATKGDALVNVALTAGHGLPKALSPFRSFRLAETDPAAFERAIVRRARVLGAKLHSGLAYGMSKAFALWYTRDQAVPFGDRGARIMSVSPGSFDTAMGQLEKDHRASEFLKVAAIKRFGRSEEVAAVLAFCASTGPGSSEAWTSSSTEALGLDRSAKRLAARARPGPEQSMNNVLYRAEALSTGEGQSVRRHAARGLTCPAREIAATTAVRHCPED